MCVLALEWVVLECWGEQRGWVGGGFKQFMCLHLIRMCPVFSVAGPGSAPAVFCTSGSMWTDSCSPPAAFYAPAPDGMCSAGPFHLGPAQR